MEGISEGHLIQPTAQSGANFRSSWEYLRGGGLHSIAGQLFPLLDHPYSEKPHISYISILVSVAASIEACSLRVVYPHYFSTLPSTGCISAPCFFSGTLHSFYPTQTQMQSQFWPVEGWHLIAGSGLRPVFY